MERKPQVSGIIFPLALVAYTVGIVLSIFGTVRRTPVAGRFATFSYVIACLLHLAGILGQFLEHGNFAVDNLPRFLLVLAWLVNLLYIFSHLRWRVHATGMVLPPIAFIMTVIALLLPSRETEEALMAGSGFLLFHIALATVGMAAFFVAASMSMLYVVQDHALKHKLALRWLERLPSLSRADSAGWEAMLWGFALFSLGIVSGLVLNTLEHQKFWFGGPKQVFPVLAWGIFAAVLLARLASGFRGRKAAYLTIAGFILSLLTIIGISL